VPAQFGADEKLKAARSGIGWASGPSRPRQAARSTRGLNANGNGGAYFFFEDDTHPSGARYEGQFVNNTREGFGVLYHPNGSRYEGHWHERRPHGFGRMVAADGSIVEGYWDSGILKGALR
jgi:hypothetical protein